MQRKVTAIIPMKHHSERVPQKNFRLLCGKPLFYWVISELLKSKYIQMVVVDTDSDEIAKLVSYHFNILVLRREPDLLGDMVGINPLIGSFLRRLGDEEWFLQTHSTNPLLTTKTIDGAISSFFSSEGYDSLFSVNSVRKRFYYADGRPINHDPANMLRTQDLQPFYEENSNIYIFSRSSFYKKNHRIGEKPMLFQMDPLEAVDVDEEPDFKIVEALFRSRMEDNVVI